MNDERLDWFSCYPSKLLGAIAAMDPEPALIYMVVLLRIYEVSGPCPDDARALSRRTGLSERKVQAAIDVLTAGPKPKLTQVEGGLMNDFATGILSTREELRAAAKVNGAEGGKKSARKRQRNQQNEPSTPSFFDKPPSTQIQIQIQKEDSKESSLSDDDWPENFRDEFWRIYPPGRKTSKRAVFSKLETIRRHGDVTWAKITESLAVYSQTDAVLRGFAKGPLVWLNQGCWDDEIARVVPGPGSGPGSGPGLGMRTGSGSRGRTSFGDLASNAEEFLNGHRDR